MESDPDEDDEGNRDDSIMQSKSKKSACTVSDNEKSDPASEEGDNEEEISEHDEELVNLNPKALKMKIISEVRQIFKCTLSI